MIKSFPYLKIDETWGTSVNLFNSGFTGEKIKISFRRGQKAVEKNITLFPNARFVLEEAFIHGTLGVSPDPFAISIMARETVQVLTGLYMKDSSGMKFFNIIPAEDMSHKPECLYNGYGTFFDMDLIENSYAFWGHSDGRYLSYKAGCIVDFLLSEDYMNNTHPIVVGDCCRIDGENLAGHPGSSHSGIANGGGFAIDINYPRYDGGFTQYRPANVNASPIFNDAGELLVNFFDHLRFVTLLNRLRDFFPKMIARVDQRIKNFLAATYGAYPYIQGDLPNEYQHNSHCHIDLGRV